MTRKFGTVRAWVTLGLAAGIVGLVSSAAVCQPPAPPVDTTPTSSTTTTVPEATTTTTLGACTANNVTPNPIAVTGPRVTVSVCYAGFAAGHAIYVSQCDKPTSDATFDPIGDCSTISVLQLNPSDNVSGTGRITYKVFHGAEPSGDDSWGCFKPGETAPDGITNLATCYVRISSDTQANITGQQSIPVTFF